MPLDGRGPRSLPLSQQPLEHSSTFPRGHQVDSVARGWGDSAQASQGVLALNQGWSSGEGCGAKSLKEGPWVRRGFWEEQETEEGIWGKRGRGRDREGRGTAQRSGEETQGGRLGVALEVWCPSLGSGFCCWWAILLLAQPQFGPWLPHSDEGPGFPLLLSCARNVAATTPTTERVVNSQGPSPWSCPSPCSPQALWVPFLASGLGLCGVNIGSSCFWGPLASEVRPDLLRGGSRVPRVRGPGQGSRSVGWVGALRSVCSGLPVTRKRLSQAYPHPHQPGESPVRLSPGGCAGRGGRALSG